MRAKGVKLRSAGKLDVDPWKTKSGNKRRKTLKSMQSQLHNAVWGLRTALMERGSFRPPGGGNQGSDWMVYTPKDFGKGRFDYAGYALKLVTRDKLPRILDAVTDEVTFAAAEYILSRGAGDRMGNRNISRRFR